MSIETQQTKLEEDSSDEIFRKWDEQKEVWKELARDTLKSLPHLEEKFLAILDRNPLLNIGRDIPGLPLRNIIYANSFGPLQRQKQRLNDLLSNEEINIKGLTGQEHRTYSNLVDQIERDMHDFIKQYEKYR